MSEFVFKLPDLGEGTVEAEIVEWHVKPGDTVEEGDPMVDVMTDKANVDVPAPVSGKIVRLAGEPGDVVAVGAELVALETDAKAAAQVEDLEPADEAASDETAGDDDEAATYSTDSEGDAKQKDETEADQEADQDADSSEEEVAAGGQNERRDKDGPPVSASARAAAAESNERQAPKPQKDSADKGVHAPTSPAIRRRAKEAGVDLASVQGSGPGGRILRRDLDAYLQGGRKSEQKSAPAEAARGKDVTEVKIIGIRRLIAQRLSQSASEIPHFAYVEEVDVTELSALRLHLNETYKASLTLLPFLAQALIRALPAWPQCNAHFDAEEGVLKQFGAVHLGIATQTDEGLKVPVVHDAQALDLWQLGDAIREGASAARDGSAKPAALSGSTVTISSLGRLGGIASTPIINRPETAIIGINKAVERPVVRDGQVQVRTIMNISGSFDHRFIDGADAAGLVADMKNLLEHPASMWIRHPPQ